MGRVGPYVPESLKTSTREKRGNGIRQIGLVQPFTKLPKNWKEFLRVDENKQELFTFLSEQAVIRSAFYGKEIYATQGASVVCSGATVYFTGLAPCAHKETDSRIFVHVADAVYNKTA